MDGFRHDYMERTRLPFFERMVREGAYSRQFKPVFPPVTFPSHSSEATGVTVALHGIAENSFYDSSTHQEYRFPTDSALLTAEPIWLTAARQGARSLVFDWPLSQNEKGPVRAAYSSDAGFDHALDDTKRLGHVLDTWRGDVPGKDGPLRLLMGYVVGTDPPGHQYGPEAPEMAAALQKLDGVVGTFFDSAVAQWKLRAGPEDRLYVLLTTDHGMDTVKHVVNLQKVLELPQHAPGIVLSVTGNLGSIFLDPPPPPAEREARLAALEAKLANYPFAHVYRREKLPEKWGYAQPTRVGDLLVVLPSGYNFDPLGAAPVADLAPDGEPKGMHGYPVEEDPKMEGVTFIWRWPKLIGGVDLGEVDWDQYHPTVARWLGIQPAPGAKGRPIVLPGD
jgi:predicted AlkP superfamily pyrophosphatase or phosphodiesterase